VADDYIRTWIGNSDADHITIGGRDLATEVMGHMTLTELAYYLITQREATGGQRRVLDAVLVSLADHGLTPTALAARLTYTGAPEATQGAVAAGLLGAGSVFLGPAGDTAEFLAAAVEHHTSAADAVAARIAAGLRVPGLGHPLHKVEDPRTPRLYALAGAEGLVGPHLQLLRDVAAAHEAATGKRLPVNGAGAGGAALVDIGIPPGSVRGVVLIARTAGLVAHLAEEARTPIGHQLYAEVEHRSSSSEPA
jgi:citrate synthase